MTPHPPLDDQIILALIAAIAGIVTTWLTVKYRDRIVRRNNPNKPKDRMDTIFDAYDKLIIQQQIEIDRKQGVVANLETIINNLEQELATTRDLLGATKEEMSATKSQNTELKAHLTRMRKEYEPHTIANS